MATTVDTWLGNSGNWSDPANWSLGVPGPANSASFATTAAITVTVTTTDTIAQLLEPANPGATLLLDSGVLTLLDGGIWDGVFVLARSAELAVSAQTLTLAGPAALDGVVAGPGTVTVTGFAETGGARFTGSAVLQDLGTIAVVGALTLGTSAADAATLAIGAGATFDVLGDFSIGAAGAATIVNAGLFAKNGAGGTSFVSANLNNTGTITVDHGTLSLDGGNDLLGGTIAGSGELDLRGGGQYTLAPGLVLDVGTLGILDNSTQVTLDASASYGGIFTLGNFARLDMNGRSLTLSGSMDKLEGTIAGPGAISVRGTADASGLLVTGGAGLADLGTLTQDGVVNLGTGGADAATLTIAPGAVYDLLGDVSINAYGSASINNAGMLEKLGLSGTSIIRGSFVSSGTIQVDMGTLGLEGPTGSLAGTLAGSGELDLRGGGSYVLGAGIVVSIATLAILDLGTTVRVGAGLTDAADFALGSGASLVLGGGAVTLSDEASLDGTLAGPGTVSVTGTAYVSGLALSGTAALDDHGVIIQNGALSIGSSATDSTMLMIESGATYDLISDDPIVGTGAATIANSGLFAKIGIGGFSAVSAAFSNTGTIAVSRGTLAFTQLSNAGAIVVGGSGANATLVVAAPLAANGGAGTVRIGTGGTVVLNADVATGESIVFAGARGLLALAAPAGVAATISRFAAGDTIDLLGIVANGLTYANGRLGITETSNGTLTTIATLSLPAIANPAGLALVADGHGGTAIQFAPSTTPPGTVINDNWTAAAGDWSNAANWIAGSTSVVPGPANDAVIAPAGTAGFVVGFNTVDTVWQLHGGAVSSGTPITLAMGGGTLTVKTGGSWSGSINETAGTFDAVSGFSAGSLVLGSAAAVEIDSGVFSIGSGTLAGRVLGAGELQLAASGQFMFQAGLSLAVATLDLAVGSGAGASVTLGAAVNYAGDFILEGTGSSGAALLLNGNGFSLAGTALLDGSIVGPGTVGVIGLADLAGLVLSGSVLLHDTGTITQDGLVTLGSATSDTSALQIDSSGIYAILADVGIAAGPSASIDNAGLFEKAGSNGASVIAASFTNTGTLDVATGLLSLAGGSNSLGGTVTGAGTLLLGPGGNFMLVPGLVVTVGTLELGAAAGLASSTTLATNLSYAGSFVLAGLNGSAAILNLNGQSLALSGTALLQGAVDSGGPGTLSVSGTAEVNGLVLNGAASLVDGNRIIQDGALVLNNSGSTATTLQIAAGATYDLVADVGIAVTGAGTLGNSGLLEKTGALGVSTIQGNLDNAGTILAQRGTLMFAGGTVDILGGTLAGAGEIDFDASGTVTLQNGIVLSVATLGLYGGDVVLSANETYAGHFTLGSGATLVPNGFALTLTGTATLAGGLQNSGSITVTGTAEAKGLTLAGNATLGDSGVIFQDGMVTLGTAATDAANIVIASGATYDFLTDGDINSSGNAGITNNGLLEETGAIGTSYLFANIVNTGTIAATIGTLSLRAGTGSLGGRITGAGEIDLNSAGTYTLLNGLTLDVAAVGLYGGADIVLGSSRTYVGTLTLGAATNLDLNGHALALTGAAALDGMIRGAGSLTVAGSADASGLVVYGGAALNDSGIITQDGAVTLGSGADTAVVNIAASGTYDFLADVNLAANGNVIVNNAGLFEKTGGTAASTVQMTVDNTGTIAVASGTLAFAGNLLNDGLMRVAGGELLVSQSLAADANRSGTIRIAGSGEALLQGAASSAEAIVFAGGAGILGLVQPTRIGGTMSGFGRGDTIDLVGATFTPGVDLVSFAGQVLTITNGGTTIAQLNLAGNYSAPNFQLADDGAHGTAITANIPCFLAGTRILTLHGEVSVEHLQEGDRVLTRSGRARPIVWIGRQRIACARHPAPDKVLPVRISAGAFAADMPRRDLLLSPDHAVFADGVLIPVKHLINGITIRQDFAASADYFHVELPTHDILLAEQLPVESYLDSGNRAEFANRPDFALHPGSGSGDPPIRCAPLCVSGPPLATLKRVLLSHLEQSGYGTTAAPDLHLVAAGRRVWPATVSDNCYRFILPGRIERVRITSRGGVPAETTAESEDRRRLGVAIEAIVLDGRLVALEDMALGAGFYDLERHGGIAWRWTDGGAALAIAGAPTGGPPPRLLELLVRATTRSWLEPRFDSMWAA